jgi:hypothetical protein
MNCDVPARWDGCQAFRRYVIDDVEDADASAARELIVNEIERPAGFGFAATRIGTRVGAGQ